MIPDKHVGRVVKNDDPDSQGGLSVRVDTIVEGQELGAEFLPRTWPFAGDGEGFFFVPAEGALVEVEVEADPERAVEDLSARVTGVLYSDSDAIPSECKSDPVNRGALKFGDETLLMDKKSALTALISLKLRLGEELASHPVIRGDTYNTALSTFLDALTTYLTAGVTYLAAEAVVQNLYYTFHSAEKPQLTTWKNLTPGIPAKTDELIAYATALETPCENLVSGITTYIAAVTAFSAATVAFITATATFKAAETSWLSTKVKTE